MKCPRCQHENRPTARFCEDCGNPLNGLGSTTSLDAHLTTEVERHKGALPEALDRQAASGNARDSQSFRLRHTVRPRAVAPPASAPAQGRLAYPSITTNVLGALAVPLCSAVTSTLNSGNGVVACSRPLRSLRIAS